MTCVLGMVVRREREIRSFVKTPFYRVICRIRTGRGEHFDGEWRAVEGSRYFQSPYLYKENGFKEKKHAQELIRFAEHGAAAQTAALTRLSARKKTRTRRFFLTWRSFRMTAPSCSRSARMRLCGSLRNSMRRNWSLIRERTPECFPQQ